MNKKILLSIILTGLLIIGSMSFTNDYSYANQMKNYTKFAGEYIKNNPDLLSKSIDSIRNEVHNDDVVTRVNSLPISFSELKFRQGLRQAVGIGATDYKSVFNTLVEEKLIFDYAIKNNVLATQSEVDSFIESEKFNASQDEQLQKIIDEFILSANMSLDDYWNSYEYYNAFRIVTFKNAYDHAVKVGIKKGALKNMDLENIDIKTLESKDLESINKVTKEHQDYWKTIKKDMKNKTSLTINTKYLNQGFSLDTSKLYLGGE